MAKGKVALGFCAPSSGAPLAFIDSLVETLTYDWREQRLINGRVIRVKSGPTIDRARNMIAHGFLEHPDKPEWLLMVDSDMSWERDAPYRLLTVAGRKDHPVVGALCHALDDNDKPYPTIYDLDPNEGATVIRDYPDGLCKVSATGAAFLLIHRDVLTRLKGRHPGYAPWFAYSYFPNGQFVSEDWTFCLRCNAADIPVYVDTRVRVGHVKEQVI